MTEHSISDTPKQGEDNRVTGETEGEQASEETGTLSRQTRSTERPKKPDNKHYTGGLDSLGGGRLP